MRKIIGFVLGSLAGILFLVTAFNGVSYAVAAVYPYAVGGTGTTTGGAFPPRGQILYVGNGAYQSRATTTATCSGTVSCTGFDIFGTSPVTITGSAATGGFNFSADTNYNQQVYSTSTPTLWFKSGLFASSTSYFANLALGATSSSMILTVDPQGIVVASSTPTAAAYLATSTTVNSVLPLLNVTLGATTTALAVTGSSTISSILNVGGNANLNAGFTVPTIPSALIVTNSGGLAAAFGGSSCSAGNAATSISALGALTCSAFSSFSFPWTSTTNFGITPVNATTTPIWFQGSTISLMASSTAYFNNTSATNATSTISHAVATTTRDTSRGIGFTIGTTTALSAQGGIYQASSTAAAGDVLIDWNGGNTKTLYLTGNINVIMNSTSSNPVSGFYYGLRMCQDGTGSRTATFVTPGQLRWPTLGSTPGATTTISSAANSCSIIGFYFDGVTGIYSAMGSTTGISRL